MIINYQESNLIVIFFKLVIHPVFLLNLIINIIENYYETDKCLIENENSHIEYENRIKPRIIIFQIFINIFKENYIQINIIQETNQTLLQKLFNLIIEMLLSIKVESILSHFPKANLVYSVIKVVFNKYIDLVSLNKDEDFDIVIKYIEEGIDSLDNICILSTYNIVRKFNIDI